MAKIEWGSLGSRHFESGLDRGVLYVNNGSAVPWNGLVKVSDETTGGNISEYYMDGTKYLEERRPTNSAGSIDAFTYPDEFSACDGTAYDDMGFGYHDQVRETFGLSYRTLIGDEVDGLSKGYKINLIYNALAAPNVMSHDTVNGTPQANTFTWSFTTTPLYLEGRRPTARFTVDTTKANPSAVWALENILYGSSTSQARLPTPEEIATMLTNWSGFQIIPSLTTGVSKLDANGVDDLSGDITTGIMTPTPTTRLVETSTDGIYRLD